MTDTEERAIAQESAYESSRLLLKLPEEERARVRLDNESIIFLRRALLLLRDILAEMAKGTRLPLPLSMPSLQPRKRRVCLTFRARTPLSCSSLERFPSGWWELISVSSSRIFSLIKSSAASKAAMLLMISLARPRKGKWATDRWPMSSSTMPACSIQPH